MRCVLEIVATISGSRLTCVHKSNPHFALVGITAQGLRELMRGEGSRAKTLRAEALAQAKLVAKAMSGKPRDALAMLQTRFPGLGQVD